MKRKVCIYKQLPPRTDSSIVLSDRLMHEPIPNDVEVVYRTPCNSCREMEGVTGNWSVSVNS